ncbi:hypothetical protein JRQ81_018639 [Phrynocephalus forsythii]|uniref:Uncharacterized protein n=1 Tax=Phrynocephalus forsythii TaxID=171643 RepID=A0A9Q1AZS5_9SAUR|nr:hypothetical protein JRQ81_018639 [Phrynocephalus forsythii]
MQPVYWYAVLLLQPALYLPEPPLARRYLFLPGTGLVSLRLLPGSRQRSLRKHISPRPDLVTLGGVRLPERRPVNRGRLAGGSGV